MSAKNSTENNTDPKMIRTSFWIEKLLLSRCDASLEMANCRSRNEFVNEAIHFYIAWLNAERDQEFFSTALHQMVDGIVRTTENRLARLHFKSAVEAAKLAHLLASLTDVDDEALRQLHIRCVEEVKRINGIVKLEDAMHNRGNE